MKLCKNCNGILSGKQRMYCSDACRKAHKRRKADKKSGQTNGQNGPAGLVDNAPQRFLHEFADKLSDLNSEQRLLLRKHLADMADYENTWVTRTLADKHIRNDWIPVYEFTRDLWFDLLEIVPVE